MHSPQPPTRSWRILLPTIVAMLLVATLAPAGAQPVALAGVLAVLGMSYLLRHHARTWGIYQRAAAATGRPAKITMQPSTATAVADRERAQ
ncbi:hypothetical protein OHA72_36665 [Dactylosporangium sp. NBC_01737]|uniref:hypothetical protein n=1 Tax=Dactylosporangium sp. NBC_01737 TaxID=2975959 RepID=UPI002E134464|nr:hypothetical protein OHA72_36665 [Dactylosporangium sp. NBC_01737]